MKSILKHLILFIIGGICYYGLECLWRGYSHWTMAVLGGTCFIVLGGINELIPWSMPMRLQCLVGAIIITLLEFITGCIVNVILEWNVWDYSNIPFNIEGQICLPFSILWFGISGLVIVMDDWLRYWLFKEDRPHYRWS